MLVMTATIVIVIMVMVMALIDTGAIILLCNRVIMSQGVVPALIGTDGNRERDLGPVRPRPLGMVDVFLTYCAECNVVGFVHPAFGRHPTRVPVRRIADQVGKPFVCYRNFKFGMFAVPCQAFKTHARVSLAYAKQAVPTRLHLAPLSFQNSAYLRGPQAATLNLGTDTSTIRQPYQQFECRFN